MNFHNSAMANEEINGHLIGLLWTRFCHSRLLNSLFAIIFRYPRLLMVLFLFFVTTCILFGSIFFSRGYPSRDSGACLYIAQSILDGKIPYKDAWDNKPPAIFYIDALGLVIGKGSIWGVWLVELLFLYIAVILCMKTLSRAFGISSAFFGSMAWLAGLMLLFTVGGTNLQEEYAITLKFAALWLFLRCEDEGYRSWRGFLLGVTGAFAFLFRQNLIGVHLGIGIYLLLTRIYRRQAKRLVSELFWIMSGGSIVVAIVVAYFASKSALGDFIDVAFLYNMIYSAVSLQSRFDSSIAGFIELAKSGIGIIAVASWLAGLIFIVTGQQLGCDAKRLLSLAIIVFPFEILFTGISGRGYGHYYQAWLPIIAVLTGFYAGNLFTRSNNVQNKLDFRAITWQLSLMVGIFMLPIYVTIAGALPIGRPANAVARAADYVREFTQPNEYVLVWGSEPSINFVSNRRSPTKFFHQYPLLTRGYVTAGMIKEFIAEIEAHRPALIIDTSPINTIVPPIDDNRREGWKRWGPNSFYAPTSEMDEIFVYFNSNYKERGPLVQPQGVVPNP